ncbi:hypothetical protein AAY473_007535 [Plecturocebus cupreus]
MSETKQPETMSKRLQCVPLSALVIRRSCCGLYTRQESRANDSFSFRYAPALQPVGDGRGPWVPAARHTGWTGPGKVLGRSQGPRLQSLARGSAHSKDRETAGEPSSPAESAHVGAGSAGYEGSLAKLHLPGTGADTGPECRGNPARPTARCAAGAPPQGAPRPRDAPRGRPQPCESQRFYLHAEESRELRGPSNRQPAPAWPQPFYGSGPRPRAPPGAGRRCAAQASQSAPPSPALHPVIGREPDGAMRP